MKHTERFSLGFYFTALTGMLKEPRIFFGKLNQDMGMGIGQSLGFLTVSSLFFSTVGLINNMPPNPLIVAGILFTNAIGMTCIAAGLGYMVMVMIMGKQVSFTRLFAIYALANGVTLLASWMPFFICLTEPWKWWLIGTGMTRGCGFKWTQATIVIALSIITIVVFFISVLPVVWHPA